MFVCCARGLPMGMHRQHLAPHFIGGNMITYQRKPLDDAALRLPIKRSVSQAKIRKCLHCNEKFVSEDFSHRLCDACKQSSAWHEEQEQEYGN